MIFDFGWKNGKLGLFSNILSSKDIISLGRVNQMLSIDKVMADKNQKLSIEEVTKVVDDLLAREFPDEEKKFADGADKTADSLSNLRKELSGITNESDTVFKALSALYASEGAFDLMFTGDEGADNLTAILNVLPDLTDEFNRYAEGLITAEEFQKEFLNSLTVHQLDGLKSGINDVIEWCGSSPIRISLNKIIGYYQRLPVVPYFLRNLY